MLALLGLLVAALARLLLPGPDPMSILDTISLGLAFRRSRRGAASAARGA